MCVHVCRNTYIHLFLSSSSCLHPPLGITRHASPVMCMIFPHHCVPSTSSELNHRYLRQGKPAEVGSSKSVNFSATSKSPRVFCLLDYHLLYLIYIIFLYLGHLFLSSRTCWGASPTDSTHSVDSPQMSPFLALNHTLLAASLHSGVLYLLSPQQNGPQRALGFAPSLFSSTSPLLPPLVFFPQHLRLCPTCAPVISLFDLMIALSFLSKLVAHYNISIL